MLGLSKTTVSQYSSVNGSSQIVSQSPSHDLPNDQSAREPEQPPHVTEPATHVITEPATHVTEQQPKTSK